MGEAPDELEVLAAGEVLVDRGVLARQPDAGAYRVRFAHDVEAEHFGATRVGVDDRRERPHRGRLAGAVGPEEPEHRAGRDVEVDTVEGDHVAEALLEPLHGDG